MRGPGNRMKYDVRRLWRCPQCGYERHVAATAVSVRCHCSKDEPLMKLVEHKRTQRAAPPPLDLYIEYDENAPEEAAPLAEADSVPAAAETSSAVSLERLADEALSGDADTADRSTE